MNIFEKCNETQKELKNHTKYSEKITLRTNITTFERLKNTADVLHLSRNELINMVLNKVLL